MKSNPRKKRREKNKFVDRRGTYGDRGKAIGEGRGLKAIILSFNQRPKTQHHKPENPHSVAGPQNVES